jgi:hypothetical protein
MAAHHPRPSSRLCNDLLAVIGIWPTGGYQELPETVSPIIEVTAGGATAAPDPPIWAADGNSVPGGCRPPIVRSCRCRAAGLLAVACSGTGR